MNKAEIIPDNIMRPEQTSDGKWQAVQYSNYALGTFRDVFGKWELGKFIPYTFNSKSEAEMICIQQNKKVLENA